jgi:membrane protease YdiL (CAAX protease family)
MENLSTRNETWLTRHPQIGIIITAVSYLLLGTLEYISNRLLGAILYFIILGVLALVLMPYVLGLPLGKKTVKEFCLDIRLIPMKPVGRNILIGLMMAALTISFMYIASILTGKFVLDWNFLPPLRWVKGLTRGIWEEVFFRGIILVLFFQFYDKKKAIFYSTFLFAIIHLGTFPPDIETLIDIVSIFFMGLAFTYLVLKTGSLLPGIIFHYVHDIFVLLVQNTPGANKVLELTLFYAFLWAALGIGVFATKKIVDCWPNVARASKT